ncbi:DUF4397 domain-containing protein [Natrialbaceae archaeon GCM10025810]|uniref:DUF4397 domain-containing protein n=1 Tax=Halovalidus salilacus TaxID=3075124 RepID=UPI003613AC75
MTRNITRRRALTIVGGTGLVALAGCAGEGDAAGDDEMDDANGGGPSDDEETNDSSDGTDSEETSDGAGDDGRAMVRVAHLSLDAPNVDVSVDGDTVLEDVAYRDVSDYLELEPGTYEVAIAAADDPETVVFEDDLEIAEGAFTVAAIGELAEENQPFAPTVLEDDMSDPGEEARVRLVHASPDAPAVDVTVGDGEQVLFEDAAFGDAASAEVPPDEYALEVRPATENNDGDVVAEFDVAPEAGGVYTAFAVGYLEPGAAPADEPFDLEVTVDAEPGGH